MGDAHPRTRLPSAARRLGGSAGAAAFAVMGTAAVFTGVVGAPPTGAVLVAEMTGTGAPLPPLLIACFAATVTADRLGSEPVYDTLRRRMPRP
ncbi:chloride channel protein [Streptomyces sp. NPDC056400]|uniref:chloride channel protein n=1 Tax=Streptomyces sp. NPDC056400 TaxID=3345808 RepID=UPI0035DB9949